jgi:hypothetical protein
LRVPPWHREGVDTGADREDRQDTSQPWA